MEFDYHDKFLQALVYTESSDEPTVAVRLNSEMKVVEIVVPRELMDKVKVSEAQSPWLDERDRASDLAGQT